MYRLKCNNIFLHGLFYDTYKNISDVWICFSIGSWIWYSILINEKLKKLEWIFLKHSIIIIIIIIIITIIILDHSIGREVSMSDYKPWNLPKRIRFSMGFIQAREVQLGSYLRWQLLYFLHDW